MCSRDLTGIRYYQVEISRRGKQTRLLIHTISRRFIVSYSSTRCAPSMHKHQLYPGRNIKDSKAGPSLNEPASQQGMSKKRASPELIAPHTELKKSYKGLGNKNLLNRKRSTNIFKLLKRNFFFLWKMEKLLESTFMILLFSVLDELNSQVFIRATERG